jgi:hypothetical protein
MTSTHFRSGRRSLPTNKRKLKVQSLVLPFISHEDDGHAYELVSQEAFF